MAASAASARHYFAFHEVTARDNGNNNSDNDDDSSGDDDCMRDRAFVELLHKWGLHVMLPSSSSSAAAAACTTTTTTSLSAAAPHAPSSRWLLRRFRYTVLDDAPPPSPRATTTTTTTKDDDECGARGVDGRASEQPQDTTSSRTAGTTRQQQPQPQLPYHDGLAHSLLLSLFDSAAVQTLLGVRRDTHHHSNNGSSDNGDNSSNNAASTTTKSPAQPPSSSPPPSTCVTAVHYTPLRLRWTTLSPLRRLVDARVVRCVVPSAHTDDDNKHTANTHDDNKQQQHMTSHSSCSRRDAAYDDDDDEAVCMPVVKRPELLLPGDVVIADALRALFLAAHSRPCTHAAAMHTGDDSDNDDDDAWCDACVYGYDDGDGDDDGVAVYALRRLRRVFARDERDELLYHVVWRLVAGGGALNQFDDDWAVYKAAARALLRTLVAGSVTAVATTTTTTTTVGEDGDDACVRHASSHNNNNKNNDTSTTHYTPQLRCYAYAVHDVTAPFALFRTSDGVVPSNLNYCYVIVHPAPQEVTLWYNSC